MGSKINPDIIEKKEEDGWKFWGFIYPLVPQGRFTET